ncbi:MAG: hypothetical protein KGJ79_16560 [Alphaproteobacteria bacterium]|nr:hypothetical protein [Alphaproteobacteria bacterium]MDE2112754.1 hypothetical protein [Alphaproteobacteria bacterium]MDE2495711.1 hypothetical protein [Alphaproteobacteria bacterium]
MARYAKGVFAGFVATAVLSVFMVMKQMMGMMPQLDVVAMLTTMVGASSPLVGWGMHFMIGSLVWGGLFAAVQNRLPGGSMILRGVVFGIGAWFLMMAMVMPMAGAGLFGLGLGIAAPIMTLMLHMIFGATLGAVYGWKRAEAAA